MNANHQILVTYATRYGATAEIAQKIAETLRQAGLSVEVRPANQVSSISNYSAVVLGSAVYAGQWHGEAVKLLEAYEKELAQRPVWLFSSGPTGEGDPVKLLKGWRFPEKQQPIADRIRPRDIALFHGEIDMQKLNFAEKLIIKGFRAPTGDFRDWNSVTAWATAIAETLKQEIGSAGRG